MAKTIRNWNELQKILEGRMQLALKQTQNEVAKCLQESINEYYKEKVFRGGTSCIPLLYERTYVLLNSIVKTEIVKTGNMFTCEVKIDELYLQHEYLGGATGLEVVTWNEESGLHGGRVQGDVHIWTDTMIALDIQGGILSILKDKLKKCGININ